MVSLRDFWHFPQEVDYSLICVSTMHHLEHCQFCIIIRFCFGTELHCTSSAFRIIPWFSVQILNIQFPPLLVMSWSVAIVNMNSSLVTRRFRLGHSCTVPWAVTSPRDTRRERLANVARSNMAAFSVWLLQLQQVAENLSLEQEEFLCACQSDKQSLVFLRVIF